MLKFRTRYGEIYFLLLTFNLHKTIYQLLPQSVELFGLIGSFGVMQEKGKGKN